MEEKRQIKFQLEFGSMYAKSIAEIFMSHKIAIITGGSRGIGKAIALRLGKSGIDSIITYKSSQAEAGASCETNRGVRRPRIGCAAGCIGARFVHELCRRHQGRP